MNITLDRYSRITDKIIDILVSNNEIRPYLETISDEEIKVVQGIMYEGRENLHLFTLSDKEVNKYKFKDPEKQLEECALAYEDNSRENNIINICGKPGDSLAKYFRVAKILFSLKY